MFIVALVLKPEAKTMGPQIVFNKIFIDIDTAF